MVKSVQVNKIYKTKIIRQNNELSGIGIIDDIIVFIDYAIKDEVVKVKINKIFKNYAIGSIVEIIEKSKDRVEPICPYFFKCGGCDLMHIDYSKQLELKKEKVKSILKKICNIDISLDYINSYNTLNYRNKVVFKVDKNKIGFYEKKTNDLIDIDKCIISNNKINECLMKIRNFIKINNNHGITEILIRVCNNEVMICIDNINNSVKNNFIDQLKDVSSIYINNKNIYGKAFLTQTLNELNFSVSPKSFFQVNIDVTKNLYNKVLSYVNKSDVIVDLYSGTGTITTMLSKKAKKVIGIEVVKDAVKDAKNNIILNNVNNVEFICDKVQNKIDILKNLNIDIIIMDPPRSGSDRKTLNSILNIEPKKIIYVSCNPVTLARDINILKEKYMLKEINAYDMFLNTYHVECVCLLQLN